MLLKKVQLISLCIYSRSIHVAASGSISSFLMTEQYSIVYMDGIIFIYSLFKGHFGCLHVLATMHAAMNIGVYISLQINVFKFGGRYPEEGLLGHMVTLFFFFQELPDCFPQWLHQSTFPPAVNGGSFISNLSNTLFTCVVDNSHSNWCEVVSHCSFDLHFPNRQ